MACRRLVGEYRNKKGRRGPVRRLVLWREPSRWSIEIEIWIQQQVTETSFIYLISDKLNGIDRQFASKKKNTISSIGNSTNQ
jgi:hypothetical protein